MHISVQRRTAPILPARKIGVSNPPPGLGGAHKDNRKH